jgi:hypothetical protein
MRTMMISDLVEIIIAASGYAWQLDGVDRALGQEALQLVEPRHWTIALGSYSFLDPRPSTLHIHL